MPLWSTNNPLVDGTDYPQVAHVNELRTTFDNGWIPCNTWAYGTFSTPSGKPPQLTVAFTGDGTQYMSVGDKFKFTLSSTVYTGYIISVSYSNPTTTLTLIFDNSVSLSSGIISANYYSKASTPNGHGLWLNWTPVITGTASMTYTISSTTVAKFCITGRLLTLILEVNGTIGGTLTNEILLTLPVNRGDTTFAASIGSGYIFQSQSYMGYSQTAANATQTGFYYFDQRNFLSGTCDPVFSLAYNI